MKYYLITADKHYIDNPEPLSISQDFSYKDFESNKPWKFPDRQIVTIRTNDHLFLPDYFDYTYPMISTSWYDAIHIYQEDDIYKQVVLIDSNSNAAIYFIPFFQRVDCISEKSLMSKNGSRIEFLVLKKSSIPEIAIFYLPKLHKNCFVVRCDLMESMLRRGGKGIILEEVIFEEEV